MDTPFSLEENYRVFFEQATNAVVLIEPHTSLILQANKSASALLGIAEEELYRTYVVDFDIIESENEL